MAENFELNVIGDEIPDESVLLRRLQEALHRGTKKVNIINGYVVDTNSSVRMLVGPVLGEITTNHAIVMIEVVGKTDVIPISAKLYKEYEKDSPTMVLEKEAPAKRPVIFQFEDLESSTEYTGKLMNLNFLDFCSIRFFFQPNNHLNSE